ncbi:hypothetical protein [Methylocella silvestris]|uniref:DUF2946 domain-containing protein n=1 Tax=Methylocella silvestris TaxID=199596 RepID=A0A2J7THX4_METSI|nr:hypothetical protein [Methylocella silvestris]PNG26362.1 hypothetical protein CR492_08095 [Methylocella silvestris]
MTRYRLGADRCLAFVALLAFVLAAFNPCCRTQVTSASFDAGLQTALGPAAHVALCAGVAGDKKRQSGDDQQPCDGPCCSLSQNDALLAVAASEADYPGDAAPSPVLRPASHIIVIAAGPVVGRPRGPPSI